MRPCARPGFDGRPERRPVGGGDAKPDRGAGGAEGLARGEDHRDHGVLALLTELIFEGFGHIAHHTSSVRPSSSGFSPEAAAEPGVLGLLRRNRWRGARLDLFSCRGAGYEWQGSTVWQDRVPRSSSSGSSRGYGWVSRRPSSSRLSGSSSPPARAHVLALARRRSRAWRGSRSSSGPSPPCARSGSRKSSS